MVGLAAEEAVAAGWVEERSCVEECCGAGLAAEKAVPAGWLKERWCVDVHLV